MKLTSIILLSENAKFFTRDEIDKLVCIVQQKFAATEEDDCAYLTEADFDWEQQVLNDIIDGWDEKTDEDEVLEDAKKALAIVESILKKIGTIPILVDYDNPGEVFIGKDAKGIKVGSTITKKMDSSSPPASWTEVYIVTRIDHKGLWGYYADTENFHEYSGEDMR